MVSHVSIAGMENVPDDLKLKEECGVIGVLGRAQAAQLTCLGLHALQHRGQESAGIATFGDTTLYEHKGMGLVRQVFDQPTLDLLVGSQAIGHVRYSTTGASEVKNAQPICGQTNFGQIALAHNGNLVNSQQLRFQLEQKGHIFCTDTDTEVIYHLIKASQAKNLQQAILETLRKLQGAFSLVILSQDCIYGVRDPHGYRPLSLGKCDEGYFLASETCAFDQVSATYVRDLRPGEIVTLTKEGVHSLQYATSSEALCAFELIYLAKPNSRMNGQSMYHVRKELGKELANHISSKIDLVIPVPDSGVPAALGLSEALGVPFQYGLIKNDYVGRTFILPEKVDRAQRVRWKLSVIPEVIKDQRILVVDDSIVRGTTSQVICQMLLEGGAKEIHLGISSSPVIYPCNYGIDISQSNKLIAASHTIQEIQHQYQIDSLIYQSLEGMQTLFSSYGFSCCTTCFDGKTVCNSSTDE